MNTCKPTCKLSKGITQNKNRVELYTLFLSKQQTQCVSVKKIETSASSKKRMDVLEKWVEKETMNFERLSNDSKYYQQMGTTTIYSNLHQN